MRYNIVRNGGYMSLILCIYTITITCSVIIQKTVQEFCSNSQYLHNIEPGETYKLILTSETPSVVHSKVWFKSKRKCNTVFRTSDGAAHFVVSVANLSIPYCNNCACDYIEISATGRNRKRYCGNKDLATFSSKSDSLEIEFHHGLSTKEFNATLIFSVERNSYFITGIPKVGIPIETPFFPDPYPANYRAEYILQSNDLHSHVLLLFLDFQISHQSFIEVSGNNGTHPSRFYGNTFRPPAIVSQSNRLSLKFVSNDDQQGMPGFRAVISSIQNVDGFAVPHTDCSGSRDGRGGVISIKTENRFSLYDCVWHILPFTPFTKSNTSVSTKLLNIGHKSILEFRSGHHSKSKIIEEINCESDKHNCSNLHIETIVPASENLYIRFNGYLDSNSVINISYSIFHMGDCSANEFACEDGKCFLKDFRCDGIEHCPNGTDEKLCPYEDNVSNEVTLHPHIHPEKFQNEASDKFLVFVVLGSVGLIATIITISFLAFTNCKRRAPEASMPQAIEEMSDTNWVEHSQNYDIQPTLHPPDVYDNPPSYDDFIKSSSSYPPVLYSRAQQRYVPQNRCMHCTTSFCTGSRIRRQFAGSFNIRGSQHDDIFVNMHSDDDHPPTFNRYDVELLQNNVSFKSPKNSVYRCYSLDSNLNNIVQHESCHLLLSIVRPQCSHVTPHLPRVPYHTLPSDYKMSDFQKGQNKSESKVSDGNVTADRKFTWSFVPRGSLRSDITTVVKTRCFSEPHSGINVQCSLY